MTHHEHRPLAGKRAAVMIGPLFEDSEATYPYYRLQEAGAEWEDAEVVVDRNLVSSRRPPDLPAFMRELIGVAEREPVEA